MEKSPASGTVIAQRYAVIGVAGGGGMGTVYRARDERTGATVALKFLLENQVTHEASRFHREAQLLAELEHPGIVRYLDQGVTDAGQLYLVMEWLEGEDLSRRLRRQCLSLAQGLLLMRSVSAALGIAHRRGIIHRDLKPSNLFLRGGQLDRVAILDFGIARRGTLAQAMTTTGVVVGTPEYMAPEQARGKRELGPPTDVFALGCVLFECLTGQPPFLGEHIPATLAKILFQEPPPLRELVPEAQKPVEELLCRMLAKDPADRPADADALLAELLRLKQIPNEEAAAPARLLNRREPGLGRAEQQFVTVLMVTPAMESPARGVHGEAVTLAAESVAAERSLAESIRAFLGSYGVHGEVLADGSLVMTLQHREQAASDQVTLCASFALFIKELWPGSNIALATGRGVSVTLLRLGKTLLQVGERRRALHDKRATAKDPPADSIHIDELSAGLLNARFRIASAEGGTFALLGESSDGDPRRCVLGELTPCFGREVELAALESALDRCESERVVSAVMVTAPLGMGKSRLCYEFLTRRQQQSSSTLVLFARGDQLSAGVRHGLIGRALLRLCGVLSSDPPEQRQGKLRGRLGQHLLEGQSARVVEALAELCRVPLGDVIDPNRRTAVQDPRFIGDPLCEAFVDFLRAECAAHPVLLVIDDVQWGDALSAHLIESALRELAGAPFMVLGFCRAESDNPWWQLQFAPLLSIPLQPLGKRASQRLVRQLLKSTLSTEAVDSMVRRAGGNPLFLEELITAAAEGKGEAVPDTILALLQARLNRLEPRQRHVLLAGSVFGETFKLSGLAALIGDEMSRQQLLHGLAGLVEKKLLDLREGLAAEQEPEYCFHHALSREAVYCLLTDEQRLLGHRLAGRYLEQSAAPEAQRIAEHYACGGELRRAADFYLRAAEEALIASDPSTALCRAERGVRCAAQGQELGALRGIQAWAHLWRRDYQAAYGAAVEALSLLPRGGGVWHQVTSVLFSITTLLGKPELLRSFADCVAPAQPQQDTLPLYVEAAALFLSGSSFAGLRDDQGASWSHSERLLRRIVEGDDSARGWLCMARFNFFAFIESNPCAELACAKECVEAFERAGDTYGQILGLVMQGSALMWNGDPSAARQALLRGQALAEQVRAEFLLHYARTALAFVRATCEEGPPSSELCARAEALFEEARPHRGPSAGLPPYILACVRLRQGELGTAESIVRAVLETDELSPAYRLLACGTLVEILLRQGRIGDARTAAEAGLQLRRSLQGHPRSDITLRLAVAKARFADNARHDAQLILGDALFELQRRASTFSDVDGRTRYLNQVPDHARLRALARQWCLDPKITAVAAAIS